MCQTCKTAHDVLFDGDENHSVAPAASLAPSDLFDEKCTEHHRELDYVCNDCNGIHLPIHLFDIIVIFIV